MSNDKNSLQSSDTTNGAAKKNKNEEKSSLLTFFNNLRYLFRYNIKQMNREFVKRDEIKEPLSEQQIFECVERMQYELKDDLANLWIPDIKSPAETLDYLLENRNASLSRYGDGEFMSLYGEDIPFQNADPVLSQRLKEILKFDDKNLAVAIPYTYYHSTKDKNIDVKYFMRTWVNSYREKVEAAIDKKKTYYSAEITQLYAMYETYDFKTHFDKIKALLRGRDITIICAQRVAEIISKEIFEPANSIEFMYAPVRHAFSEYDEILKNALTIDKNRLVIAMLGPTATVLAYDMFLNGHQVYDFGHVGKDYLAYKKNSHMNTEVLHEYYSPD